MLLLLQGQIKVVITCETDSSYAVIKFRSSVKMGVMTNMVTLSVGFLVHLFICFSYSCLVALCPCQEVT